jgi:hypothetical protein
MTRSLSVRLAADGPQADPLAPLRRARDRRTAVATLEALRQTLLSAGARALQGLQVCPVTFAAPNVARGIPNESFKCNHVKEMPLGVTVKALIESVFSTALLVYLRTAHLRPHTACAAFRAARTLAPTNPTTHPSPSPFHPFTLYPSPSPRRCAGSARQDRITALARAGLAAAPLHRGAASIALALP